MFTGIGLELDIVAVIHERTHDQKLREPELETELRCACGSASPKEGMCTESWYFCEALTA